MGVHWTTNYCTSRNITMTTAPLSMSLLSPCSFFENLILRIRKFHCLDKKISQLHYFFEVLVQSNIMYEADFLTFFCMCFPQSIVLSLVRQTWEITLKLEFNAFSVITDSHQNRRIKYLFIDTLVCFDQIIQSGFSLFLEILDLKYV